MLLLPPRPMTLLQFYAHLLFRAASLLTAGLALACLMVIAVLVGPYRAWNWTS